MPNVRLDSVKPAIDDEGRLVVHVDVVARNVGAVEDFIDALEKTGAFRDLLSRQERENKEGLIEAAVQGLYDPAQAVKVSR